MIEGATALTRMPSLATSSASAAVKRRDRGFAGGIGDHAGAAAPFQRGAGGDIDDAAAAAAGHRLHGGAAAQHAADEIHVELLPDHGEACFLDRRRGKAAGNVDRGPERRDVPIKPFDRRFVGEVAGDRKPDLRVVAQAKPLCVGFVESRARGRWRRLRSAPKPPRCRAHRCLRLRRYDDCANPCVQIRKSVGRVSSGPDHRLSGFGSKAATRI